MPHTTRTLYLEPSLWDIQLNNAGGIDLSTDVDYSSAQNVANECRLFTRDAYFAYDEGIPYYIIQLGDTPIESIIRTYLRTQALKVEQVESIYQLRVNNFDIDTRSFSGTIAFYTEGRNEPITLDI